MLRLGCRATLNDVPLVQAVLYRPQYIHCTLFQPYWYSISYLSAWCVCHSASKCFGETRLVLSHIQCSMDSTRLVQGSLVNLIKHDILELKKGMIQ